MQTRREILAEGVAFLRQSPDNSAFLPRIVLQIPQLCPRVAASVMELKHDVTIFAQFRFDPTSKQKKAPPVRQLP